jgi:hypothetical protein
METALRADIQIVQDVLFIENATAFVASRPHIRHVFDLGTIKSLTNTKRFPIILQPQSRISTATKTYTF